MAVPKVLRRMVVRTFGYQREVLDEDADESLIAEPPARLPPTSASSAGRGCGRDPDRCRGPLRHITRFSVHVWAGNLWGPCSGATILALVCLIAGAVLYGQFGTRRWLWVPGAGAAGAVILAEYQGVPVNPFSFAVVLILAAAAVATSVIGIIKGHVARSAK